MPAASAAEKCTRHPLLWPGPSGIAYGWEGFCLKIVHAGNLLGTSDAYGEGDKAEGGVIADACE